MKKEQLTHPDMQSSKKRLHSPKSAAQRELQQLRQENLTLER